MPQRALKLLWKLRVWVISKDSCVLGVFHLPVNDMVRMHFCWGFESLLHTQCTCPD